MSGLPCGVCGRILARGERVTLRRKGADRREVPVCLTCYPPCEVPGCGGEARVGATCERCDRAIRWARERA